MEVPRRTFHSGFRSRTRRRRRVPFRRRLPSSRQHRTVDITAALRTSTTTAMASLRTMLRLAPRARYCHISRVPTVTQRTYATPARRPATDSKSASDTEHAEEDLASLREDPNMVGLSVAITLRHQGREERECRMQAIDR